MYKFRRDVDHKLQCSNTLTRLVMSARHVGILASVGPSFYRWRAAYRQYGLTGLDNRKTAPKNPANRTAPEIIEKVLHLRTTYRGGCRYQRLT